MNSSWQLTSLVNLLLQSPRYAGAVRTLLLKEGFGIPPPKCRWNERLVSNALKGLALTDQERADWKTWLQGKDKDTYDWPDDSWRALLLTLLPNFEMFKMDWVHDSKRMQKVFERAAGEDKPPGTWPTFRWLREFSIPEWDNDCAVGVQMDFLQPLIKLPGMRRASCWGVVNGSIGEAEDRSRELFRSSNVTHISLHSSFCEKEIAPVILACKRLESFVYEHIPSKRPLSLPALYQSLYEHKGSFTEIDIHYEQRSMRVPSAKESMFLGSFQEVRILKSLRLRAANLLDWAGLIDLPITTLLEVFPMSLKSISIDESDEYPCAPSLIEILRGVDSDRGQGRIPLSTLRING
ncbi:hypothetical protein BDW74DRAFT_177933 [Aspergillus multicolor]|uniref:uncharacterized protein n=1 Tax=Aspergillus multicolor TaxID=41759 RepID=UPI003CCE3569